MCEYTSKVFSETELHLLQEKVKLVQEETRRCLGEETCRLLKAAIILHQAKPERRNASLFFLPLWFLRQFLRIAQSFLDFLAKRL